MAPRGYFYKGTYLIELGRGFCFFRGFERPLPAEASKGPRSPHSDPLLPKRTFDIAYCVMENISR